jgi:hypothetical protein
MHTLRTWSATYTRMATTFDKNDGAGSLDVRSRNHSSSLIFRVLINDAVIVQQLPVTFALGNRMRLQRR